MIKSINEKDIPESRYGKKGEKRSEYREDIKNFLASDDNFVECFCKKNRKLKVSSVAANYRNMVNTMKAPVKVQVRGDRIFMMKERINAQ